jgi:hypothetical protein
VVEHGLERARQVELVVHHPDGLHGPSSSPLAAGRTTPLGIASAVSNDDATFSPALVISRCKSRGEFPTGNEQG